MTEALSHRLAGELERLFCVLARRRGLPHEDEGHRLTTTQRLALLLLADRPPLRLGALADEMGTTDATASRTVDALEEAGLVRREPDPADRRCVLVGINERGLALVDERRARLAVSLARGLAGMPEEDKERLVALLGELNHLLESG